MKRFNQIFFLSTLSLGACGQMAEVADPADTQALENDDSGTSDFETAAALRAGFRGLALVDRDCKVVARVTAGQTLNLAALPTNDLGIQIETEESVGAIRLGLRKDGAQIASRSEREKPFTLPGDSGGSCRTLRLEAGAYEAYADVIDSSIEDADFAQYSLKFVAARGSVAQPATPAPSPMPDLDDPDTVDLPAAPSDGCSCARPALATGVMPTLNNVGACGPTPKVYPSTLDITSEYVAKNGRVIQGIDVRGTIRVFVSGVKICNFKAETVKIMSGARNVQVQDGSLDSKTAGLFLIFTPDSSGSIRRIRALNGKSDGIRVTKSPMGETQEVSQSYFGQIAKYRSPAAHADMIQTYPQLSRGDHHASLIKQNYFESADYPGHPAVNAIWMGMRPGARFEDNYVAKVHRGFWIDDAVGPTKSHHVLRNVFAPSITNFISLKCGVGGIEQRGNVHTTGKPINGCQ